jgi:hypothetical protein
MSNNWLCPLLITTQHVPRRNTPLRTVTLFLRAHSLMRERVYWADAQKRSLFTESPLSNGSICHNMIYATFREICLISSSGDYHHTVIFVLSGDSWVQNQCILNRLLACSVTVAARSRARIIFGRSWVRIPLEAWMFAFILFVSSCIGSGLAAVWSPAQGVRQTVCMIKKL